MRFRVIKTDKEDIARENSGSKFPGNILKHYQVIGDIAIVSVPEEMGDRKSEVASAIMDRSHKVRTVLNKVSKLEGDRRVADFEILAGDSTETLHREFGFAYRLDLRKVFFNPGLGSERRRVASLVRPGEHVLVPFCGVGPFAIPAAAAGAEVVAVEMNSDACKWLAGNCRLNKVEGNIHIINADAGCIARLLRCSFDRAIVPTPYGMDHFLETICPLVKPEGNIHFYTFKVEEQIPGLIEEYNRMGLDVEHYRRCGNVAPGVSRWVFDLKKST